MNEKIISAALAAVVLTGCATHQQVQVAKKRFDDTSIASNRSVDEALARVKSPRDDSDVGRAWLAAPSVPLAKRFVLPEPLRAGVKTSLMFKGSNSVDLMEAASQITAATKIPVRVKPDALMPATDFLPKTLAAGASGQQRDAATAKVNLRLPDEMGASEILDYIAAQLGVSWEYRPETGIIEIYRLVTRTLEFRAAMGTTSVELGLGRSGGAQGVGFQANSSTKVSVTDIDPVKDLKGSIDAMLTRAGSGTIGGGVVVVTDTKEAVDRIAAFVERENRLVSRRVRLVFEAIEVSLNDTGEAGMDWELLYKKINSLASGDQTGNLGFKTVGKTVSDQAAGLNLGLVGNSRFSGSSVVISALSEFGTVVNHVKTPIYTQNKRPAQYAVRTTFDYVAQVDVTSVVSNGSGTATPSIKQKEESIGTTLTVTPVAFDDGQIMMSLAYDATTLRSLKPYSVGGAGSASPLSTVQQRTIDGSGALQTVQVRPGQTLLISGFDRDVDSQDQRRLDKTAPMILGGGDKTVKTKTTTLLLVTAVAED